VKVKGEKGVSTKMVVSREEGVSQTKGGLRSGTIWAQLRMWTKIGRKYGRDRGIIGNKKKKRYKKLAKATTTERKCQETRNSERACEFTGEKTHDLLRKEVVDDELCVNQRRGNGHDSLGGAVG